MRIRNVAFACAGIFGASYGIFLQWSTPEKTRSFADVSSSNGDSIPHYEPSDPPPVGRGKRYFVSPSGHDVNNGLSEKTPFLTLQRAQDATEPGDVVMVMAGTYGGDRDVLSISRSGTARAWITYMPYPGSHPRIRSHKGAGISLFGARYIRISGFELEGNSRKVTAEMARALDAVPTSILTSNIGVAVSPDKQRGQLSHHIWLDHLHVHHFSAAGIQVNWTDYLTIEDNVVSENAFWSNEDNSGISVYEPSAIDHDLSVYKIVIRRNIVANNENKIKSIYRVPRAITDGHGIIIDNGYHSHHRQGELGEPYTGRILVADNVAYSNGASGFTSFRSGNVDFISNTSYHNVKTKNIYSTETEMFAETADNTRFYDNIIVPLPAHAPNWVYKDNRGIIYDYNLYFGGKPPRALGPHDLIADPRFVKPESNDFRLRLGSPAIDSGLPILPLDYDLLHVRRPRGAGTDRGAYEFAPPRHSTTQ